MRRSFRIVLISLSGVLALLLLVGIVGVFVLQSQWFYNKVRDRIVTAAETATGGNVSIRRFTFDWHTMTATILDFTIRGTEPVNGPPLLHADQVVVGLKIVSLVKRDIDIALLRIDQPKALLLVAADGSTNIPNPKTPSKSNKSAAETILDMAVGRFELNNGSAEVHGTGQVSKTQPYSLRGNNLKTLFMFDAAVPRYHGDISVAPLDLAYGDYRALPATVATTLAIEKNRLVIEKSSIASGDSALTLNGRIENFNAPVITAEYKAKVSVAQTGTLLKLKSKQSGWLEVNGSASYKAADDYAISGFAKAYNLDYRAGDIHLRNVRAEAKIDGGPKTISINDVKAYALGGAITAKAEIRDFETFKINGEVHHFNVRQLASLATQQKTPYDGSVGGTLFTEGKIIDLKKNRFIATARLNVTPAGSGVPVRGLLDLKYSGFNDTVDLGKSFLVLPNSRLDVSGILGRQLQLNFASSNLNDLLPVIQVTANPRQPTPVIPVAIAPQGQLTFKGTVTGPLASPVLAGHLGGTSFSVQGQTIDSIAADISASKSQATVANGSLRQKNVSANFSGSVGLRDWSPENNQPLTASLDLRDAELHDLLSMAGKPSIAASGTLNANAKVSGTIGSPQATADLTLSNGTIAGEPFDRITTHLDSPNRTTQAVAAQLSARAKQVNATFSYVHGAADFFPGKVNFSATSNNVRLNQIVTLNRREPDLLGSAKLHTEGTVSVVRDAKGNLTAAITKVDGDVEVSDLQLAGKRLGNLDLTANTSLTGGKPPVLNVKLRSNLAEAVITADGAWTLADDYNGSAKLQFSKVNLDTVRRLALSPQQAESVRVGGSVEGTLELSGPAAKPEQLRAALELPKLEVFPLPGSAAASGPVNLTVRNSGPIRVSLADNVVRVESAKLTAQDSTFELAGSAGLTQPQKLDLRLNGDVNLSILHLINNTVVASGIVQANATAKGTISNPLLGGSLQLKNANLAMADLPNGLSNANGTVEFAGTQAVVRNMTAESGGGKVTFGGFASLAGGTPSFRLRANAASVRVRYPQGVSVVGDAQLNLVGTASRSVLSGTITVSRISFNPRTDFGSVLSSASAPPETPSSGSDATSNMQLDVQLQSAPDITFESSYTESLDADANLRLRGSLANPALLGRINITQGDITFFGNKYTINQGSVSFFNPVRIEPILNVDLETVARGVDVTLTVSGPVTKLNVSYRSDPPLQFSDIVGLLATGRTPNDASIAARQPTAPQQSWQQMGASAIVGQAIANPVAGRLQRFFGVSKLKIDPTISGVTGNPQAKVTLEQQITPSITFTYITDVANAQEQVIRVEWDFSPHWSAVALRDQNGEFGIDFLYKKRFR